MNYLLKILNAYFAEVLSIEGRLTVSECFLNAKKDDIIQENRFHKSVVSSITCYRDLSLLQGGNNLFTPDFSYEMGVDNMANEIKDIISQQSCFAVSQAYEAFETFLIELTTEYLFHNQGQLKFLKFTNGNLILLRETIRDMVKRSQGVNNKGLLAMIRKISPHFRSHEAKNIYKVNISQWFDLVTMIRHTLVHNRQVISNRLLMYIEKQKANEMFNKHFKRKSINNNVCIYLEKSTASDIINWLNTFAHFIFVGLSKEANLSLHIPQYIPPPINDSRFSW
jgi:hypothetical protein